MSKAETFRKKIIFEVVVAIIMAALAILCFVIQIYTYSSKTSTLETALFNLLQFLLTVGFSWYGSRAISRTEFENSLKKFALSAYRRVCDIDKMLERLQRGISNMLSLAKSGEYENLRVVSAVVDDTKLIVNYHRPCRWHLKIRQDFGQCPSPCLTRIEPTLFKYCSPTMLVH
jgi:uncharacterized membrane protein YfbV (UPF0208 family)